MSRRYTPEEKANALVHLQLSGDISSTAHHFGIPERTLFDWRRDWYAKNPPPQSSPRLQQADFEDDLQALAYLRKQIMTELIELAGRFREGAAFTTPTQRIHVLSQLLDRLMKLDQHLKPYKPQEPEFIRMSWDAGLYLRTEGGYRGPYSPQNLPQNWREQYGPSTRLEIYWGDSTFTVLPDEGYIVDYLFNWKDLQSEPCDLAPDTDEEEYGIRYG